MVVDTLRKILGLGGGVPNDLSGVGQHVQPAIDYDEIISRLQMARMEIDRMKYQLVNEIDKLNTRLLEAARKRNMEEMEEYAAEIVLKKKVLRGVLLFQKLISISIERINDARSIEALVKALAPLDYAMKGMNEFLYTAGPEIMSTLSSIKESTEKLIKGTDMLASNLPQGKVSFTIDEEVRREIARALREAQVESDRLIPSIPIEGIARERLRHRNLERELLEYIKRNNGVLNVRKAAKELGITPDDVRRILFKLQEKGVIKVTGRNSAEWI